MTNFLRASALASLTAAVLALGFHPSAEARGPQGPVPGKPGDANIVEIAQAVNAASGEFSYLLAAATCEYFEGAVAALLTGGDKYTLFAPTDAAFIALQGELGISEPAPEATCALPREVLFDVLAYHVVEGRRFSNSLFNRNVVRSIEMLNGQYILTNPNLTINDNAGQTVGVIGDLANINAGNGVIHVIDTVLLPFAP
jgi:uncharacterized surface protein with fasciclin (FAS1) repeats